MPTTTLSRERKDELIRVLHSCATEARNDLEDTEINPDPLTIARRMIQIGRLVLAEAGVEA